MGPLEVLEAVRAVENKRIEELKNYGDVGALLRSNPFFAALFNQLVAAVCNAVAAELEKRLPPPELDLLTYEDVARIMKKSVSAVRQMKARGYIKAAKHNILGKTYFTKEAVTTAVAEMERREAMAMERRQKDMSAVRILKEQKAA